MLAFDTFMRKPVPMQVITDVELSPVSMEEMEKRPGIVGYIVKEDVYKRQKEGYILRTSEDLLDLMQITTGRLPYVFPLATQDITPYGNDLHHLNSVLQPCTATNAPVVGCLLYTSGG